MAIKLVKEQERLRKAISNYKTRPQDCVPLLRAHQEMALDVINAIETKREKEKSERLAGLRQRINALELDRGRFGGYRRLGPLAPMAMRTRGVIPRI